MLPHQNSSEVSPSAPSAKNGALAFLRVAHAPKANVDEVAEDEVSSRHKEETLADKSKPTLFPLRSGLWTRSKDLKIVEHRAVNI